MIGRTNAIGVNSGGSGGVTTVDLPTRPASIAYNAKNQNVDIILTYSSTDLVSGVRVAYKTGAYPENPDDGEYVEIEGTAENVNVPNLTNGTTYYFRVFLYREIASVKYFQTDITNARILCIPRAVEVTGITPMVQAADHLVFTESGTFTLTANTGTRIILGSGGGVQYANSNKALVGEKWAKGGYVKSITLTEDVFEAPCIMTIAGMFNQNTTTLKINSTSYTSGSTQTVIDTKWGPIGGNGGESRQAQEVGAAAKIGLALHLIKHRELAATTVVMEILAEMVVCTLARRKTVHRERQESLAMILADLEAEAGMQREEVRVHMELLRQVKNIMLTTANPVPA